MKLTETNIKTVAVLGAGTMGQGIVQVFASAGYTTLVYDVNADALTSGIVKLKNGLKTAVVKGKLTVEDERKISERIIATEILSDVKADLVIEAVIEDLSIKQEMMAKVEAINERHSILATNTSSLSVTLIASALTRPDKFLGIHFFNPAPVMPLVEVVAGKETDSTVTKTISDFMKSIGKQVVHSADTPGFIVNRIARHYYLESLKALEEEVCSPEAMDALLRSAGFKMGPFELMDLIGVDINYAVSRSVYQAFNNIPRFKPSKIQEEKVRGGKLGRKTGEGFYKY